MITLTLTTEERSSRHDYQQLAASADKLALHYRTTEARKNQEAEQHTSSATYWRRHADEARERHRDRLAADHAAAADDHQRQAAECEKQAAAYADVARYIEGITTATELWHLTYHYFGPDALPAPRDTSEQCWRCNPHLLDTKAGAR